MYLYGIQQTASCTRLLDDHTPGYASLPLSATPYSFCDGAGLGVPIFRDIMSRETFEAIKASITFAARGTGGVRPKVPKSSGLYPRLWKVQLLLDRFLAWGAELFVPGLYIVIDEAMVFCRGANSIGALCALILCQVTLLHCARLLYIVFSPQRPSALT